MSLSEMLISPSRIIFIVKSGHIFTGFASHPENLCARPARGILPSMADSMAFCKSQRWLKEVVSGISGSLRINDWSRVNNLLSHPLFIIVDIPGASEISPTGRRTTEHQGISSSRKFSGSELFKIVIRNSEENTAHHEVGRSLMMRKMSSRVFSLSLEEKSYSLDHVFLCSLMYQ